METKLKDINILKNARQLGGYVTADGRKIRQNVLLRTAQLADATAEEIAILRDKYQVKDIIDFRSEKECTLNPDPKIEGASYHWIDVMEQSGMIKNWRNKDLENKTKEEMEKQILESAKSESIFFYYKQLLTSEGGQNGYREFFQILLDNREGAIVWHCTQGKDRTGIAAVLLLSALGVERNTIIEDYEQTNAFFDEQIKEAVEKVKEKNGACPDEMLQKLQLLIGVSRDTMERVLNLIDDTYGSMELYLQNQMNLTRADMETLKQRYLES